MMTGTRILSACLLVSLGFLVPVKWRPCEITPLPSAGLQAVHDDHTAGMEHHAPHCPGETAMEHVLHGGEKPGGKALPGLFTVHLIAATFFPAVQPAPGQSPLLRTVHTLPSQLSPGPSSLRAPPVPSC